MGYASERFRLQRRAKHERPKTYEVSYGTPSHGQMLHMVDLKAAKPDPLLKGMLGGNCNREACQAPGAKWFNTSTRLYYCTRCAREINRACAQFGDPQILFLSEGAEADQAIKFGDTR